MLQVMPLLLSAALTMPAEASGKEAPKLSTATFAGGCFWCMQPPFDKLKGKGVVSTTVGYTGGKKENPAYEEVSEGTTGHAEAIQVVFDPARIGYEELLEVFWRNIDPTTPDRQFVDVGEQYRPGVFYHDAVQKKLAEASRDRLDKSGRFDRPVRTEIVPASTFYPAEAYHQEYYRKNPVRYKIYRYGSGRDQFLRRVWDAPVPKD